MSYGFFDFMDKLKQFLSAALHSEYFYHCRIRFKPVEFYIDRHGQWISLNFRLLPPRCWFLVEVPSHVINTTSSDDDYIPF